MLKSFVEVMLHKFRVQYILIDFSDNGFLVFQCILFRFSISKSVFALWPAKLSSQLFRVVLSDGLMCHGQMTWEDEFC